jgi:outer membrane protein assembly factor BamE (lipoprotein component of BamABCDE complex)
MTNAERLPAGTSRALRPWFTTLILVAGLAACSGTIDQHGHVVREQAMQELRPGAQTRDDVVRLMGTPSSKAPFDENTWYYIGQKTKSVAFFKPELQERNVIVVRFDDSGLLRSVNNLTAEDGKEVAYVERETPTAGHELGLMEQLLGNVGRFNPAGAGFGGGRGGGGTAGGGPAGGF